MSNYDPVEIAAEVERLKKDHVIDLLEAKDNRRNKQKGQADADDIERLLPSAEQQARDADHLERMLSTASRAGAGGTTVGLPGLRPSGGVAASKFIEDNVGVGRIPKAPDPAESNTAVPEPAKQYRTDTKRVSVAIYDRCMDCMKPVPQHDVVPNLTWVPDYSQVKWFELPSEEQQKLREQEAKWKAVRLYPGEGVGYLFHHSCVKEALDSAQRKRLVVDAKGTTQGEREMKERAARISRQVHEYIAKERNNPNSDIFHGEAALR